MKRPLFVFGISMFFSCFLSFYFKYTGSLIFTCAILICATVFLLAGRRNKLFCNIGIAGIAAAFGAGYMLLSSVIFMLPAVSLSEQAAHVTATVTAEPDGGGSYAVYTVKTTSVDIPGAPQEINLRLYSTDGFMAEQFDEICGVVEFDKIDGDYGSSYNSQRIFLSGYLKNGSGSITKTNNSGIREIPANIRKFIKNNLYTNLDYDSAALASGVILGDRSGFSDEMSDNFAKSGISHMIAVSGMHLSLIVMSLLALMRRLKVNRKAANTIALGAVLLVCAVSGFTPSICRSGIMYAIMLIGNLFFVRSDSLNSLGAAAVILIIANPFSVVSPSFQLSFLSTLGMIVVLRPLNRFIQKKLLPGRDRPKRIADYISFSISASVSALAFTLPVTALIFTGVSVIAPLSNLLSGFAAGVVLLFGAIGSAIAAIPLLSAFSWPFILIAGIFAKYIDFISKTLSSMPFSVLSFNEPVSKLALAACLAVIALAIIFRHKSRRIVAVAAVACLAVVISSVGVLAAANNDRVNISVMDTESGITVLVDDGSLALIGAGKGAVHPVGSYLKMNGKDEISVAVLPMLNDTFAAGAPALSKAVTINKLLIPSDGKHRESVGAINSTEILPVENSSISLSGRTVINVIDSAGSRSAAVFANDKYILIAEPSLNIDALPDEYKHPDVIICGSAIPTCIDNESEPVVVVSADARKSFYASNRLNIPCYVTGGIGDVRLSISKSGNITVRRGNY